MNAIPTSHGRMPGFQPVSPQDDERYGRIFDVTRGANEYLIAHNAELAEQYPGEWVGMDASGVVAHHTDSAEFQHLLQVAGKASETTIRFYFLPRDRRYIFSTCA